MKLVNTTPHQIVVDNGENKKIYPKSEHEEIRLDFETVSIGALDGFEINKKILKGSNLPEERKDIVLIVSTMVLDAYPERMDLVAPDTDRAARNEKGWVISVPGFVRK